MMTVNKMRKHKRLIVQLYSGVFLLGMLLSFAPMLMGQDDAVDEEGVSFLDEKVNKILLLNINGVINPVSAEYIIDGISYAEENNFLAVIIEMDTPGGLMDSMRDIIKKMVNSEMTIVIYVYPSGSRAASAGAFITIASDIAAMSPGTNIGAASPVAMGEEMDETMMAKVTNDAVASIKEMAENNGRNADVAISMVTDAVSITAKEALEQNVIDIIAKDLDDLLAQIDEKTFTSAKGEHELSLSDAEVEEYPMGFRREFLYVLTNPNIAYILMMLGLMGLYFELSNPGAIFPGVIGGICLILAFYSLQTLPVNYAGILLILLAVILFIMEIKITSYGLLTIGGVISLFLGSIMMFKSPQPYLRVSMYVLLPTVIVVTLFFVLAIGLTVRAHLRKPSTGKEGIIGERGVAKTPIDSEGGRVYVHGEWWDAVSDSPIKEGTKVKVVESDNLLIKVKKR